MRFITVECTCKEGEPYVDGVLPVFLRGDPQKAAYRWKKSKEKAEAGSTRAWNEIIFLGVKYGELTVPERTYPQGEDVLIVTRPLPNLRDYNLYYGVHLNGLHILSVK